MTKPFHIYNRIYHKTACYVTFSDFLLGLGIVIYEMPRCGSTPCQLEQVYWNADVGATWLCYEGCLQDIHTKQITTKIIYKGTTQQWCLCQWTPHENGHSCYWIHSQVYHFVSLLYSNKANRPGYAHLYIFNSAEANKVAWKPVKRRVYGQSNAMVE